MAPSECQISGWYPPVSVPTPPCVDVVTWPLGASAVTPTHLSPSPRLRCPRPGLSPADSSLTCLDLCILRGAHGLLVLRLSWLRPVEAEGGVVELLLFPWERRIPSRRLALWAVWLGGHWPGILGRGARKESWQAREGEGGVVNPWGAMAVWTPSVKIHGTYSCRKQGFGHAEHAPPSAQSTALDDCLLVTTAPWTAAINLLD